MVAKLEESEEAEGQEKAEEPEKPKEPNEPGEPEEPEESEKPAEPEEPEETGARGARRARRARGVKNPGQSENDTDLQPTMLFNEKHPKTINMMLKTKNQIKIEGKCFAPPPGTFAGWLKWPSNLLFSWFSLVTLNFFAKNIRNTTNFVIPSRREDIEK